MFLGIDIRKLCLNALVLLGAVLIPAYLIRMSNEHVFPSTLAMANGMLWIVIIAAVACMLVASHEGADPRVKAVAIAGKVLLGIVLWWNLGGHWQLAREVDGAKSAVTEAHNEREELNRLAADQAQREKELAAARAEEAKANASLVAEQRKRTDAETMRCRLTGNCRSTASAPIVAQSLAAPLPSPGLAAVKLNPADVRPSITPDLVRANWTDSLTFRAYVEAGVAILILVLLGTLWNVDWDNDGWADRIRRLPATVMARRYPDAYAQYYPQGAPGVAPPSPTQATASAASGIGVGAATLSAPTPRIGFASAAAPTGHNRPLAGTSAPTSAPTTGAPTSPRLTAPSAPTMRRADVIEIIGYRMPVIKDVEWEGKSSKGVIVAGWEPAKRPGDRRAPRLGQFGKRRLTELFELPEAERRKEIEEQVNAWREEKQAAGEI